MPDNSTKKKDRIILIGNYKPDKQESMLRFANMLHNGFMQEGIETEIWNPTVFYGGSFKKATNQGIAKWMGYIDKWFLYPMVLFFQVRKKINKTDTVHFHVCDHSNAPYLKWLPKNKTSITCHDVLAIRGAMGYEDAYASASSMGKILQKWILSYLSKYNMLAAVSECTLKQLGEITGSTQVKKKNWKVIKNAFNENFYPFATEEARKLLSVAGLDTNVGYLLHVGSNEQRKNRSLLIDMTIALGNQWQGNICFAGHAPDESLTAYINEKKITHRIKIVERPDHQLLLALYSNCEAFVFPSFSEGFGWPIIEAQACNATLILSNIEPMPEVSGGMAMYADPKNPQAFADAFLSLQNENIKKNMLQNGMLNSQKYQVPFMIQDYLTLFNSK